MKQKRGTSISSRPGINVVATNGCGVDQRAQKAAAKQVPQCALLAAYHLRNASVCQDVACVDEAVQHLSRLLDKITLVGIVLQLLICIRTKVER